MHLADWFRNCIRECRNSFSSRSPGNLSIPPPPFVISQLFLSPPLLAEFNPISFLFLSLFCSFYLFHLSVLFFIQSSCHLLLPPSTWSYLYLLWQLVRGARARVLRGERKRKAGDRFTVYGERRPWAAISKRETARRRRTRRSEAKEEMKGERRRRVERG